jgi:hypothetical protein
VEIQMATGGEVSGGRFDRPTDCSLAGLGGYRLGENQNSAGFPDIEIGHVLICDPELPSVRINLLWEPFRMTAAPLNKSESTGDGFVPSQTARRSRPRLAKSTPKACQ